MPISGVFWLFILIAIAFAVFLGLLIWLAITVLKERREPSDDCICINLNTHNDRTGRAIFIQKGSPRTVSGRYVFTGKPTDVDWKKLRDNKEDLEPINTIINPEHVVTIPKGQWSQDKHIKILMPANAENLEENMKDTPFGKLIAQLIESKNFEKTITEIIREGSNRKSEYLQKLGDGEVGEAVVGVYEKIVKQISEVTKDRMRSQSPPPPGLIKP